MPARPAPTLVFAADDLYGSIIVAPAQLLQGGLDTAYQKDPVGAVELSAYRCVAKEIGWYTKVYRIRRYLT